MGDLGSIPVLGRSPGEGKGYPLQYSGLENSMDCIVRGVAKSGTRLSNLHFHLHFQHGLKVKVRRQTLVLALPLKRHVTLEPAGQLLLWFPKNLDGTSPFQTCCSFDQVLVREPEVGSLADMFYVALTVFLFSNSFMGV